MALNTATSIIDYLSSKGFNPADVNPYTGVRKKIYGAVGGQGEYIGSAEQNTMLLGKLQQAEKTAGIGITPQNVFDVIGGVGATQTPLGTAPGGVTPLYQPSENVIRASDITGTTNELINEMPQGLTNLAQTAAGGAFPSATELAQKAEQLYMGGSSYMFGAEAAQAAKQNLEIQAQRNRENIITDLARRGLFYSGLKQKKLDEAEVDRLAQALNIDRKFAAIIATGIQDTIKDLVKEAKDEKQSAIDALDALGFVFNPLTGDVMEKPSEQRAREAAERADVSQAISLARLGLSEESAIRAEEAAERSEIRLGLAEQAAQRAETKAAEGTAAAKKAAEIGRVTARLQESRQGGTYIDGNVYVEERRNSSLTPSDFDSRFGYLLSPGDQVKFGVIKEPSVSAWEVDAGIWQWLAADGANLSDEEKAAQIKQAGRDPESFGIYGQ